MPPSRPQSREAPPGLDALLEGVAARARAAGVFASVEGDAGGLRCAAAGSAAPAWYLVRHSEGRVWVALATEDRWLSQSIEADLVHTGDNLADLIHEEMVDLGYPGPPLPFEHFRDAHRRFTFRSPVPVEEGALGGDAAVELVAQALLGYEACFRRLGDMDVGAGDAD
ncbi:MAG TPA: hypothetical protein VD963_00450 [Phycisphaerales bacterium]|nr:hypothetical protein [Phycisphaerales bacterium]